MRVVVDGEFDAADGKTNVERRPVADRALDFDATVQLIDNFLRRRQSKSGPPLPLRGVKRLENAISLRLGNARTVVANREHDFRPREGIARLDGDVTALRGRGIDRIENHVVGDLMNAIRVEGYHRDRAKIGQ